MQTLYERMAGALSSKLSVEEYLCVMCLIEGGLDSDKVEYRVGIWAGEAGLRVLAKLQDNRVSS